MLDDESEYTRFTEQKHSPSSQHPSISQSSPFHHSEDEDDIHDTALSTRIMKHSPHGNGMNGHTHSSLGATALSATWGNNYGTVAASSPPHSTPDGTDLTPYRLRQEARTTRINVARDTSTHGIHEHEMNVMHDDVKHDGHEGGEHGVPLLLAYRHTSSSIRKDYTTVDWFFSKYQLSRMMSQLHRENTQNGWKGKMKNAFNAASGWIVLALVGVATAMSASAIHLLADWLTEIKVGYCSEHGAWVTHRVCCLETTGDCQYWTRWHMTVMPSMSSAGAYWYNYMCYIFWGVTFAGLASWLCYVYSHHAAGSGIAEIKCILGGFIIKRFLGVRTLVIKSLGLILAVASGMNLGKEGPLVHIACCWGNIFSRQFIKYSSNEVKKREVLSASAAAGVSAAFGAPLGGVLFSLEAVSSYFPPKTLWRSFWCAISAALVLQYLDPFQTGKLVQFAVSKVDPWNWFELLPFMLIGVLGGALGAIFIRGNLRLQQWRKNHRWIREHRIHEIIIIATITCIINYTNLYIRGSSTSLLAELFGNCDNLSITDDYDPNQSSDSVANALCAKDDVALHIVLLIIAGIVKFILMIATYGTFIPAGVFVPALSVGACFGRVIGWVMALWHDYAGDTFIFSVCAGKSTCVSPGIYAIVGAAATLGGITRMTVSIVVIMFEVTGSLESLVPIMIAVVCSKWVGDAYGGAGGLYGEIIEMNGFPFIDPNLEVETTGPACDIMAIEPVTVTTYGCTLKSLRELLQAHPYHGFPIIDNDRDRLVYGFISRADLQIQIDAITEEEEENDPLMRIHFSSDPPPFAAGEAKDFSVAVDKYPIRVLPDTPIDRILDLFKSLGLRYIIVTSNKGRLLGLIKKKDLLHYFHTQNIR